MCLFVCPGIHCKAEAQLAKHGWILLDISSYGKIKKWDTGLDLDKSLESGAFYICIYERVRERKTNYHNAKMQPTTQVSPGLQSARIIAKYGIFKSYEW